MKYVKDTVSSQGQELGTYQCPLFESLAEAGKVLGEQTALAVLNKGWKVLVQAQARRLFKAGKKPEEVSKALKDWKPGRGTRSKRVMAAEAITKHAAKLASNPDLQAKVVEAFGKGKWADVLALLGEPVE